MLLRLKGIACSSTPPKQNQDFVKEHNRTPLSGCGVVRHQPLPVPFESIIGVPFEKTV